METIKDWFEEFILDISFVRENLKNSYETGKMEGSKTIDDSRLEDKQVELLSIVKRIEELKILEEKRKKESDETLNDYILTKTRNADSLADTMALKKLNDLLSPVDLTGVVKLAKQGAGNLVYINGEQIDEFRLANLKAEADFITQSELWKLIYETPKELAQRAMFVDGDNLDTMKKGRGILYTLSTQKNIVDVFRSFKSK